MTFLNVIKHAFISPKPDSTDASLVRPSNWNANHSVTMTAAENTLLGAVPGGGGVVVDIPMGVGLSVSGGSLVGLFSMPIGAILDYGGGSPPSGWLYCDGAEVLRADYPDLFAVIGESFGAGDGLLTFCTPDLRGRVTAGRDGMGPAPNADRLTSAFFGGSTTIDGSVGGSESHVLTPDELPTMPGVTDPGGAHFHRIANNATSGGSAVATPDGHLAYKNTAGVPYELAEAGGTPSVLKTGDEAEHTHTIDLGGSDDPHSIIQPTMIVTKIIYAGA